MLLSSKEQYLPIGHVTYTCAASLFIHLPEHALSFNKPSNFNRNLVLVIYEESMQKVSVCAMVYIPTRDEVGSRHLWSAIHRYSTFAGEIT